MIRVKTTAHMVV